MIYAIIVISVLMIISLCLFCYFLRDMWKNVGTLPEVQKFDNEVL